MASSENNFAGGAALWIGCLGVLAVVALQIFVLG
jgi:hypothetical protein